MSFWRPRSVFGCEGNPTEIVRQVTALHRRKSRRPYCGTPRFPWTASQWHDFWWPRFDFIFTFRCLNTPQNNRPVNLCAHVQDERRKQNLRVGFAMLVSCFTRLFDSTLAYCILRNETKRNEMKRNETTWKKRPPNMNGTVYRRLMNASVSKLS